MTTLDSSVYIAETQTRFYIDVEASGFRSEQEIIAAIEERLFSTGMRVKLIDPYVVSYKHRYVGGDNVSRLTFFCEVSWEGAS